MIHAILLAANMRAPRVVPVTSPAPSVSAYCLDANHTFAELLKNRCVSSDDAIPVQAMHVENDECLKSSDGRYDFSWMTKINDARGKTIGVLYCENGVLWLEKVKRRVD